MQMPFEPPISASHPDHSPPEPLAVIGIGCRFPGGIHSPAHYWEALLAGFNAICDVPDDRWLHARFHDTNPEKSGCIRNVKGGFLDGVDQFDGGFFGYFPTEAQRMDPQQRLLLEVTHEAMEDAGLRRDQLDGSRTSVFIGSFMYDYLCIQAASEQRDEINPYVAMGTAVSPLANRISYDFNLKGPSISLDTACSSSLVSVHLACQSLWTNEADMAIAGGVNVMLRPESSIILSKAGFLNPDQYCKAFDASANGYVRGEGVGVVILKPLGKALTDGDAIYALVHGTAVNQDGYLPEGFTVPNVLSQIALLKTAYAKAGIDPLTVDFVEAHGTGTPVGDPIECLALGEVLGRNRAPEKRCMIGSVKTNLGHLEGASGIAGFIKGVLTAYHGVAPPNLHFHNPNPEIDWESLKLEVPVKAVPLSRGSQPLTVGVNSFGAGGTNAHVVVQGPRKAQTIIHENHTSTNEQAAEAGTLYILSAANRDSLRTLALRHADFLAETSIRFEDIAFSAFTRRSYYKQLAAVVGQTKQDVEDKLRRFADGHLDPATLTTKTTRKKGPRLAFVFSGQGGQWVRMGQQLMQCEPVFHRALSEFDAIFQELAGWSLLTELRKDDAHSRINDTVIVQPAVTAIQTALFKLYEHYGIQPQGVVGHSIGEVVAGFAAGALTLEQVVVVVYHRSQAQNLASGKGGMLAVRLSLEETRKLIEGHGGQVSIAAINGPEMLALSGDMLPLQLIAQALDSRGVFNRPVRVQVAYHSHHMEPIRETMLDALRPMQAAKAIMPLYSTVTGHQEDGAHLDADYWFRNARQTVLFTNALSAMVKDGFDTFVEIGPHPLLVRGAEALFKKLDSDAMIAASMVRPGKNAAASSDSRIDTQVDSASKNGASGKPHPSLEDVAFFQSLARLAARGMEPDTKALFGADCRYVRLPKHPWQHSRHWFEAPAAAEMRRGRFEHPFLKSQIQLVTEPGLAVWEAALDLQKYPYLRDHQVESEFVFPATGHIELAWAVANEQFRHEALFLENLRFDLPLIVPENARHSLDVRLEIVSGEGDYRICSRPADAASQTWSKHSSGRINTVHDRFEKSAVSLVTLREQFGNEESLSIERFYEKLRLAELSYGERFRCTKELWRRGREILAHQELPEGLVYESQRYFIHPAFLDSCLHVVFAEVLGAGDPDRLFLPYRIDRVRILRRPTRSVWSFVRVTRYDERYLNSDVLIFDESGELVAEVFGLSCKRLAGAGSHQIDTLYEGCYEYHWTPAARDSELHGRNSDCMRAVLIADESSILSQLEKRFASENIESLLIPMRETASLSGRFADVALDRRTLIVFMPGLEASSGLNVEGDGWKGLAHCPWVSRFLELAQALQKRQGVSHVHLITRGVAAAVGDTHLNLGQAILHGMARVIKNECPNIPLKIIDLSLSAPQEEIDALFHELLYRRRDRDESEIALRGDGRYVKQLVAVDQDSAEQAASSDEPGMGGAYRADIRQAGLPDRVPFRRFLRRAPDDAEVEIAVQAAALSFKDIMNAMGWLPKEAVAGGLTSDRLGLEVAGRVLRTGRLVRHVQPGDEVIARVAEGFGGCATTPGHYVVRRPDQLTPVQAATVPLVYVTAWYSLFHLARLTRGETVLIHSAAGGVGGAAIQLAVRAGAKIIATAGTMEKREYLRQIGVEHAFDSRSLDFSNHVKEVTGGRGVDIVLNSLTGRFIAQSLKCLAPFGRFVELGKLDVYRNARLGLERLGENISYFVVDVDRLAAQKPELHQKVLGEVVALFERGELHPPEITKFPISKLAEAMKFMTRAAYPGKIVLTMQNTRVQALPPRVAEFRPDRCYLVSGGASGFGLEIARWMAERGACHLVLLSRSGPKSDADRATVESMISQGVRVLVAQADVADAVAVGCIMERIATEMPPLAGMIHGAAVLDDASLSAMNMARFERVFNPKAQGAWNLHEASRAAGANLDFFVMLSSISSVLGLVGQVNYAAANFFQDALAQYRRQQGLPATSINLGVLGQYAGMSRSENDVQHIIGLLESQGMNGMPLSDALAKLEAALVQQPVQRMAARFDWDRFRAAYPHLARDSRFMDHLNGTALVRGSRSEASSLRTALIEMAPEKRRERLEHELTAKLARILEADPEKFDVTASIDVLGLDSLMLTDLQTWIVRMLDINLPLIKLLKGPSIATLSAELLSQLAPVNTDHGGTKNANPNAASFTVADLEGVRVLSPWLIRGCGRSDAPTRLICFHSMGTGASLFTKFLMEPPADYDILAVQTPGRENRIAEPVGDNIDSLADYIVPHLLPLFDRPVVIWGHSFGGIVAWEVIRRLRDRHQCEPAHFVVTGTTTPRGIEKWKSREVLLKGMVADNDLEYLMSISRYVDDPEFFKAIRDPMRRDFPLLASYRFEPMSPLRCPISAFAARQDDFAYIDEIREWSHHTESDFELIEVDGDHWFLNRNRDLLKAKLCEIAGGAALTWQKHAPSGAKFVPHSASLGSGSLSGSGKP
ncbi:MAG: SDR family NAD(P)-dependent oxidoreductase [Gemmataceae bacterium]